MEGRVEFLFHVFEEVEHIVFIVSLLNILFEGVSNQIEIDDDKLVNSLLESLGNLIIKYDNIYVYLSISIYDLIDIKLL